MKYKGLIIIVGLVLVAAIGGWTAWVIHTTQSRSGKVKVELLRAPSDAEFIINKQTVTANEIYLAPGLYSVTSQRKGFTSQTENVIIYEDSNANYIASSLEPNTDEGTRLRGSSGETYAILEDRVSTILATRDNELKVQYPLIEKLPFENYLFKIGYKQENPATTKRAIVITIHAPSDYQQSALTQIENWGYNPAEYKIEYADHGNPFSL